MSALSHRYAMEFLTLAPNREKIFFLDESGFSFCMRLHYGRAPVGQAAHVTVPAIRSRNFSLAAAMSMNGLAFHSMQDHAFNTQSFHLFLVDFFGYLTSHDIRNVTIIMDNVKFHKSASISAVVNSYGHRLVFLPPYSPFMNPIEEMFNQWKHFVKMASPQNARELTIAISNAASRISADHCNGYFRHMESYLPLCIQGVEINS
jgi:transposase